MLPPTAMFGSLPLLVVTASAAAHPLVINCAFSWPISTENEDGVFDRILREAARREGYAIEVHHPPAERGLTDADLGVADGDGPRVAEIQGQYAHLVRVEEPLIEVEFVAFGAGKPLGGRWTDLGPYHVGIVRGWKILERNITHARSLVSARTPQSLFRMLALGRVEVAVIDRMSGEALIERLEIPKARALGPPFAVRPVYLYLHERHRALAERLAVVLREMKRDGSFALLGGTVRSPP